MRSRRAPLSQRPSGVGGWVVADPYRPCWWFYHRSKGPGLTPAPQDGRPRLPTSAQVNAGAHDSSRESLAHEHPAFVKAHTGVGCQLQSPLSNCDPSSSTPRALEKQTLRPKPDPRCKEVRQTLVSEGPLVLQALLVLKACGEGPLASTHLCLCLCLFPGPLNTNQGERVTVSHSANRASKLVRSLWKQYGASSKN